MWNSGIDKIRIVKHTKTDARVIADIRICLNCANSPDEDANKELEKTFEWTYHKLKSSGKI